VGKTKQYKVTKVVAGEDRTGIPEAVSISSASPHEVTLVGPTLAARITQEQQEYLIDDRVGESDQLDERLVK
jgi:hypothetical protein